MFKDPLLCTGIHLKPPAMVYEATTGRTQRRHSRPAMTLDGVRAVDAYRAREQGQR